MKSKQLANVLIKIIGLYICLCAIPGVVSGILALFAPLFAPPVEVPKWSETLFRVFSWAIGDAVQAVVGIFLIIKSRKLAEFWFKNEDE